LRIGVEIFRSVLFGLLFQSIDPHKAEVGFVAVLVKKGEQWLYPSLAGVDAGVYLADAHPVFRAAFVPEVFRGAHIAGGGLAERIFKGFHILGILVFLSRQLADGHLDGIVEIATFNQFGGGSAGAGKY
jgi:hypothetical protein